MAFDRSRYKPNGRLIFEDKVSDDGSLRKDPLFQLPDYADGSDAYANNWDTILSFQNVRNPDAHNVFFKAFITAFNETYSPNFNATEVFGRADPIQQYKNTTRNITLAWKMPAASESEAYENLGKVQSLIQMLYPSYLDVNDALTLSQAPLVRLKVMNLLQKNKQEEQSSFGNGANNEDLYDQYISVNDSSAGLLGVITSCTINHNLEGADGVFQKTKGTILPKLIDVNISFVPLHEQSLGYDTDDSIALFPYGVKTGDTNSSGRQDASWPNQNINETPHGKSLSELRQVKKSLEEKRREATTAQQNIDRQTARYLRTLEKANGAKQGSGRETRLNKRAASRYDNLSVDQRNSITALNEATENLQDFEQEYGDFLIGS